MIERVIDDLVSVCRDPRSIVGIGVKPLSGQSKTGFDVVLLENRENALGGTEIRSRIERKGNLFPAGIATSDGDRASSS